LIKDPDLGFFEDLRQFRIMGFSSLAQIANVLNTTSRSVSSRVQGCEVSSITTDSRNIPRDALFVALRGERFDGHRFVEVAIADGAMAAVVNQEQVPAGVPCLPVPDTLAAYQALGRWWRTQQPAKIIAVTGSVGKTTTKELIAAALGTQGPVLKTQANYNNEIGVPKTLLQLQPHHDFGVVEMGMRGPGEIALLTQIAQPDVAVITNVGTAHIGRLGSEQAIANAKCELLAELPKSGLAVLNYDNARLLDTARGVWSGQTITYGLTGGDVTGHLLDTQTLMVDGVHVPLPLPGRHNARNLLAAIAVMQALNLDWRVLAHGIAVEMPSGRSRRIDLPDDIVLLDETYNAGVESMTAALRLLAETPGQRHLAVLGTMKELGDQSINLHRRVGDVVHQLGLNCLFTLADAAEAEALARGAATVPTQAFADHDALAEGLATELKPGDRVLFKASRSVELDRVVHRLVEKLSQPDRESSAAAPSL
jgi:UDP-N-acetylmuramoyl-tripeptide--D-alanyl-D-alanine ligase